MFNDIICTCGFKIKEKEFKSHYKKCKPFINKFTKFDFKIASTIEEYVIDRDNIFIVKYLFKRYLKRINNKIKEYEKEFKKKYNNKEDELKNLIKNNKNIIFGDMSESGSSLMKDVLNQNLKYIMKEEELSNSAHSFKDFVNVEIFKEDSDSMAPKPVRNDISAPPLNYDSNPNPYTKDEDQKAENPKDNSTLISKPGFEHEFNHFNNKSNNDNYGNNSTPFGDNKNNDNYGNNSTPFGNNENNDNYGNNNTPKNDNENNYTSNHNNEYNEAGNTPFGDNKNNENLKNNNTQNSNNKNDNNENGGAMDYFLEFGKNYFKSFFTSSASNNLEFFNPSS